MFANNKESYSVISFCNLLLVTNIFCRFSGFFIEKTTFEEFVEICELCKKEEIQYNDEKEKMDSIID